MPWLPGTAGRAFLEEEVKRLQNENVLARARLAKADIEKDDKEEQNRLLAFQLGLLLDMVRTSVARGRELYSVMLQSFQFCVSRPRLWSPHLA